MFFIGRLFGKSKKEKEGSESDVEATDSDTIPYALDFEGADEIKIVAEDCSRTNVKTVQHHIIRPEKIEVIVDLLDSLPKEGTEKIEMDLCTEHTLTAYKYSEPFAQVVFYKGLLKLENGMFISDTSRASRKQSELYALIEIDIKEKISK